ncbi:pre-mRNA splicing factor Clf1 [Aspergillus ellipticus CBS 707.79]|uniref:Pre-mRNA splicing factor Clf1 n=1 Tax=Aspergillus ellipticus CBS 707.79 TaxID=1448320 RepID=A0A319D0Z9_9EURO|nr:pre-mRNA splicing factor Clf1 [Aspergillus ellipticus CBS 707.79]
MLAPSPPVELEGHCSVIYNSTLYTYSANGFASIPLERNANWTELTMGEPVSDAACVTGGIEGDESQKALYVVGGTGSLEDKPGLQRYSFADKKWTTIQPPQSVMGNRTHHKAVYLSNSSSILVYGGHQTDEFVASSDTYVLSTTSPYDIAAHNATEASPAVAPVLLPWSDRVAVLVGGTTTPKGVHLFDPTVGWYSSNVTLAQSLSSDVECAILDGSDESKVLEAFDMSVSPNTISSVVLVNSGGKDANPATVFTSQSSSSRKMKRDVTLSDYPSYDSNLAASTTRSNYSLAQGEDGLVVISSGNGTDSLAIFNQTANSWVNTTKLFYGDETVQQILGSTATASSSTATATSSTTSSAAAARGGSSSSDVGTIVGATLGAILGVAAILIIILLVIKRKKQNMKKARGDNDKDRLSFQDQGVEPLTQSAYPMAKSAIPVAASSVDSLAIFSGKMGDEKTPRSAGSRPSFAQTSTPLKSSPLTTIHSTGEASSPSIYSSAAFDKEIEIQDSSAGGGPGDRRTNEGWSRYFQDNSTTASLVGAQPQPLKPAAVADSAKSQQKGPAWAMKTLTPLDFGFLDEPKPLGMVISGSPTTEHASSIISSEGRTVAIQESQSARISSASSMSAELEGDGLWQQPSWLGRPPSSTYSRSFYNPSSHVPSMAAPSESDYRPFDPSRTNTRGSSIFIPEGGEHDPMPPRAANVNTDMSWLNLNADR